MVSVRLSLTVVHSPPVSMGVAPERSSGLCHDVAEYHTHTHQATNNITIRLYIRTTHVLMKALVFRYSCDTAGLCITKYGST